METLFVNLGTKNRKKTRIRENSKTTFDISVRGLVTRTVKPLKFMTPLRSGELSIGNTTSYETPVFPVRRDWKRTFSPSTVVRVYLKVDEDKEL